MKSLVLCRNVIRLALRIPLSLIKGRNKPRHGYISAASDGNCRLFYIVFAYYVTTVLGIMQRSERGLISVLLVLFCPAGINFCVDYNECENQELQGRTKLYTGSNVSG